MTNQQSPTKNKSLSAETISLNHIYASEEPEICGYCKKKQSYSWKLIRTLFLTLEKSFQPHTYELLMQRGWRRSGTFYYKPNLFKSCCKLYTHQLDVTKFKIKKDQKKTIKKIITIAYEPIEAIETPAETQSKHPKRESSTNKTKEMKVKIITEVEPKYKLMMNELSERLSTTLNTSLHQLIPDKYLDEQGRQLFNYNIKDKLRFFASKDNYDSDYYCNYVMLLFGVNKKLFKDKKYTLQEFVKDVKHMLINVGSCEQYKVDVEAGGYLLLSLSKEEKAAKETGFQRIELSQIESKKDNKHKDKGMQPEESSLLGQQDKTRFSNFFHNLKEKLIPTPIDNSPHLNEKESSTYERLKINYVGTFIITPTKITFGKITILIVPAEEDRESYKLYELYCNTIHEPDKPVSMSSYTDFLCQRALKEQQEPCLLSSEHYYIPSWDPTEKHQKNLKPQNNITKRLGSHHMKYYLNNHLIAIGVVDIVQTGLSSVYFFYDPQFKEFRLGIFSSLIEIEYIRYMQLSFPEFVNYYMGFYIANNRKMSYKVDYSPCMLLCPRSYRFVEFTERIKEKVIKACAGECSVELSEKDMTILEDFQLGCDPGVYIDQHLKLLYKGKKVNLKEINPTFFIPILCLLSDYIKVWGKELFDIFTFTF